MRIVVVQSLFLDVLVLSCEHLMPQVKVFSSLLQSHWLDIATDLKVIVAHADCALSQHHVDSLSDCAVSLVFELRVN